MPVQRYRVRVLHLGHEKATGEEHLDLADEARLREVLIAQVDAASRTGRVRDYAEWRLDVHLPHPQRADWPGRRVARVSVDAAGRTVVTRP